ncbi:ATP-binding protein [Candidatus Saccharibacteria bacterium]|nr:ATP-binding protein [Candidatus Saccharibacteria bacterium]
MEVLRSENPTIIEMVGLPGSGKSFFAKQFAKTFGSAIVSIDKIRWMLFANHTYSDNENIMVQQVADLIITELLKTQKTFVIDGGYVTEVEREELARRAAKAGFRVLTVVVQVDLPTAKHRSMKRNPRCAGDQYKQALSPEEFDTQVARCELPEAASDNVIISGKHTYSTQARTVLKKMIGLKNAPIVVKPLPRPVPILPTDRPYIQ